MKGTFTSLSAPYLRGQVVGGLYCHSQYFGMKERSVALPTWPEVDLEALTGGAYPSAEESRSNRR